mmetsp:Transcript_20743/g.48476  ORF Transcript_20743/g.48476 Transcript_20743/m.48476 type:complete len:231 (+) Transcript_20743:1010-1702(+)
MPAHTETTGALPKDGHTLCIPSKVHNVVLCPFHRGPLVQKRVVSSRATRVLFNERVESHEPKNVHPIVGRDNNDIALLGQVPPVVQCELVSVPEHIPSAVNPKHDREGLCRQGVWHVHLKEQAILVSELDRPHDVQLRAHRTSTRAVQCVLPGHQRLGRAEAIVSSRGCSEGHTLENGDALVCVEITLDGAVGGLDHDIVANFVNHGERKAQRRDDQESQENRPAPVTQH